MAADNHQPPEALTDFERRLMQLSPRSHLQRDELMYVAGQKSVQPARPAGNHTAWQALAVCATVAAVVVTGMLQYERNRTRHLRIKVAALQGATETDEGAEQSNALVPPTPRVPHDAVVSKPLRVAEVSQRRPRRSVFEKGLNSPPPHRQRRGRSETITYWSGRELLAKASPGPRRKISIWQLVP